MLWLNTSMSFLPCIALLVLGVTVFKNKLFLRMCYKCLYLTTLGSCHTGNDLRNCTLVSYVLKNH